MYLPVAGSSRPVPAIEFTRPVSTAYRFCALVRSVCELFGKLVAENMLVAGSPVATPKPIVGAIVPVSSHTSPWKYVKPIWRLWAPRSQLRLSSKNLVLASREDAPPVAPAFRMPAALIPSEKPPSLASGPLHIPELNPGEYCVGPPLWP